MENRTLVIRHLRSLLEIFKGKNKRRLNRVSVNCTWKCSLGNCPYCWVNAVVRANPKLYLVEDHDVEEWLQAFEHLDPAILDFVGGEPFIFKGFVELIANLPKKHRYAITTNLHTDKIPEFLRRCKPDRCEMVTASFHLTAGLKKEDFADRLKLFVNHGFPVSINIVNYPPLADKILPIYDYFQKRRFITHISPYERIEDLLNSFNGKFICTCGITRYVIINNGDVYRCFTWFKHPDREKAYMGNIFNGTFRKYLEKKICNLRCEPYLVYDPSDGMVPDMHIEPLREMNYG